MQIILEAFFVVNIQILISTSIKTSNTFTPKNDNLLDVAVADL